MGNYEKAEGILDKYSKGKLSAREVQKELKGFGYKADLRGKSNTIPVYPIDGGDGFDVELAKGGAMLQKQMELFDVGGLKDEGGTKDPVSGNDVPVGSTQEEVRDDIPAQLSEGEFVLPADVVRYHGLEKIMELRDEAKAGLAKMEAMGQMGNSEEATLPDDVPFSMDDLELEDDGIDFQVGGFVPPQNVSFVPSQFAPQPSIPGIPSIPTPVTPAPTLPAYTPPTQQFVPTMPTQPTPTFGMPQTVTYYHADGRTIQIPVDSNGNPLIPVPAGFTATKPTADAPVTTPTTTTQAPVQQQEDSGPSIEQQRSAQEYKNTVNERTKAAENLGFTKKQSAAEAVLDFIPGANLLTGNPTAGTILADGTIADGNGNSFDPRTGDQVGFTGGIVGNVLGKAGLRGEPEPVKFAQNIEDMRKTIGVSDAERADADLAFERLSDVLPKEALPTTRVETAQVTKAGETAVDASEIERQERGEFGPEGISDVPEITSEIKGRTTIPADFADATRTRASTPVAADEFADTQTRDAFDIEQFERGFTPTAERTPSDPTEFSTPAARRDESSRVKATQRRQDATAAAAEVERFQRAASRVEAQSAERESTVSGHQQRYEDSGYSPAAARSAAVNKTDADAEARQQTGNANASAVTSSSGKAVRTSSGNVVTVGSSIDESDSGGGGCVIATHGVSTGGFSLLDKAKAELWCEKTYHGKWYGEAFRRGYRYYANRAVQKGVAHEYYTEFKNFVACGRGLRKDIKSKVNYYIRTIQFFATGLFVK
tara:strand:+ start:1325 stop:3637 length:2313 start_codon:yes stop_codon:yes gene_type:complete